ncbi:MAG TPA: hypothetical protein VFG39_07475 [Balneolaceae bacterium]|nr:hypothetical protein [Balneolaceae bacterium]
MNERTIDFAPLFKFSYHQYKKYASFVIGVMFTYFVLGIVPNIYFMFRAPATPTFSSQVVSFIITLIQLFLSFGFIKIMLFLIDDKPVEVTDLINNFRGFLSYFVANFLFIIAVAIGIFLFIIPGIFIFIRFQFYPYFILENGDNSFIALKKSYMLTQNLTLELFLFTLAVLVLNFLGLLLLGIGFIFTFPLTTMATAVIYKGLVQESDTIPVSAYRL